MALNTIANNAIGVGSSANDGTGDDARAAYTKCNDAFTAIDSNVGKVKNQVLQTKVSGVANTTVAEYLICPGNDVTVSAIGIMAPGSAPSSAAGAVTMTIEAGGNSLLDTSPHDLETLTGSGTVDLPTVTATSANLDLSAGEVITISLISDNNDAQDLDVYVAIFCEPR